MTRKQKLLTNSGLGLMRQAVTLVCGFVLPRYMLLYYGSNVNGLAASIAHFLSFISLLEMGISPVIQANLYGPLAKKDFTQISRIMISSERFFRKIAIIFLIYIGVLSIVFPRFINTGFDMWFSMSLVFILAISIFAEYFFGAAYQTLLIADQRAYILSLTIIFTTILNTVFCIAAIEAGMSIHAVKLLSSAIFVLRPLVYSWYVRRHYALDRTLKLTGEPIKQKWNGFAQHISAVICGNIDVVALTLFSTLENVSIYSVYYSVTNGITSLIITAATGLEAYFGNLIAQDEKKTLDRSFQMIEWIVHFAVTIIFTVAAITITPFVSVYTWGINDADYIFPAFGMLLVLAYATQCLRIPYFRIIKAAGHFKETQMGAFISAALNVLISFGLIFKWGLIGIALGTVVAMLYHTCYFVWYLRKNILNRSPWYFVKYLFTDTAVMLCSCWASQNFSMEAVSYFAWVIFAVKVGVVTTILAVLANLIAHFRLIKQLYLR